MGKLTFRHFIHIVKEYNFIHMLFTFPTGATTQVFTLEKHNFVSFHAGSSSYLHQRITKIEDSQLKSRAENLHKIMESRWAESTNRKYKHAWDKWEEWCKRHPESPSKPADPFYIAVYINDLVLEECKMGTLDAAAAGIR